MTLLEKRKLEERVMILVMLVFTALVVSCFFIVIGDIIWKGFGRVLAGGWMYLSSNKYEGGIGNEIIGTLLLAFLSSFISIPIGVAAAIYAQEYAKQNFITKLIRFTSEVLASVPSIVFGIFGLAVFVFFIADTIELLFGFHVTFALLWGALTLAFMEIPGIIRTSEEAIKAVPLTYREASFALGADKWHTVRKVLLPAAFPGIVTGVLISFGRTIGETAPIIYTAGYSPFLPHASPGALFEPVGSLTMGIYAGYQNLGLTHTVGDLYGSAFILILMVVAVNAAAQLLIRHHARYLKGR
jgi:phosphate transport system permease protein